jgi:hypothetical protein
LERSLLCNAGTKESNNESSNIDGQLELEETLDIIVHIAAPHGSLHNRGEVVVSDKNIGSFLAHISAGLAHSETNISLLESRGIVSSITSYGNDITHLAETGNQQVFILRAGSGEHLKVGHQILEQLKVLNLFDTVLYD